MKKLKFWLILLVVLIVVGGISYTTYRFVIKNMQEIELKEQDLNPPILTLVPVTIEEGKSYSVYSFLDSCKDDVSSKCQLSFLNEEMQNYQNPGTYEITILAKDEKENEVQAVTTLTITGSGETLKEPSENEPKTEEKQEPVLENVNPESTVVQKVGTTSKDHIESRNIYGTTCEYTITTYYDVYSDGSSKETGKSERETGCDFANYHATLEELSAEAEVQMEKYTDNIADAFGLLYQERLTRGLSNLTFDPLLLTGAQLRTLEIGYSNMYSVTRPNTSVSILDELNIAYSGGIEFIVTGSADAQTAVSSLLNDANFKSYFEQNAFSKLGIGLSLVHNKYIWVFYLVG